MVENSKIEWTDHTWNPWVGCTKVSPACDHCYAEGWAKRSGQVKWGRERKRTSSENWRKPMRWNDMAAAVGENKFVFCSSLADIFDNQVPEEWRRDAFDVMMKTPNLVWLLLTKRPQNIIRFLSADLYNAKNIWLGVTVENQAEADRRLPALLSINGYFKRFVSCEPLLGPLDLNYVKSTFFGAFSALSGICIDDVQRFRKLDWVIAGGESGPGARSSQAHWFRNLRDDCVSADVNFFFKQWGEYAPHRSSSSYDTPMVRVGKKTAGRILDGREWSQRPQQ